MLKVQEIREIIRLIDQSSINEFTYETGDATIMLKKTAGNVGSNTTQQAVNAVEQPVQVPQTENKPNEKPSQSKEEKTEINKEKDDPATNENDNAVEFDYEIVSPMVGTLYHAPSPEDGPYVKVGSKVENETVVCIVEAMKLFNEIEAEAAGEIVEILVGDGELVEYGQPLYRVKTK